MLIAINRAIDSQNVTDRSHWSVKERIKKEWTKLIWVTLNGKCQQATGKKIVKITSIRSRLLDMGNLIGGAKYLIDAIRDLGLIVDDNTKWVEIEYKQKQQKLGKSTIIEIEDL